MRVKSSIALVSISIVAMALVLFSLTLMGSSELTKASFDGIIKTYSIESAVLKTLGRSRLSFVSESVKKEIEDLPYISSCTLTKKGQTISVEGECVEDGVIISDGENYYFYSDVLSPLDKKDVNVLSESYTLLYVESSLLEEFLSSSIGSDEKKMITTLKELKSQFGLITKAEYDNNNSSVFSGSLVLTLPLLNAILVIEDIRDCSRIGEALEIIEKEYKESKDRVNVKFNEYRISQNLLMKMR